MITTTDIKDWLKVAVSTPSITINKLDTSKEQTICVYGGISPVPAIPSVGGGATGYGIKRLRVLIRWSYGADAAEQKAAEVYSAVNRATVVVDGKTAWLEPLNTEAVSLGTDEKGVYEYSIDLKMTYER